MQAYIHTTNLVLALLNSGDAFVESVLTGAIRLSSDNVDIALLQHQKCKQIAEDALRRYISLIHYLWKSCTGVLNHFLLL
jgi:hypothetical protein